MDAHGSADSSFRVLDAAWFTARQHWRDTHTTQFARDHWNPMEADTRAYLAALRELLSLLNAAERATDY